MKKIKLTALLLGIILSFSCAKQDEKEKKEIITVCKGASQTYTLYENDYKFCEYCERIKYNSDQQDMSREDFILALEDIGYICE